MRLILLLLALLATAACDRQKAETPQGEGAGVPGVPTEGVDRSHNGKPAPDAMFHDPDGGDISLADFEGVPVLVNLWASWCAPCIKELPTLEKLEQSHSADGQLGVIAVSQDRAPKSSVDAFLADKGIARFALSMTPRWRWPGAIGVEILPTSILYDSEGREVWRYVGDLDWTSAEALSCWPNPKPKPDRDTALSARPSIAASPRPISASPAKSCVRSLRPGTALRQDGGRRHQQGDEQRIGRPGAVDQPEIKHVAQSVADDRQSGDGRPRLDIGGNAMVHGRSPISATAPSSPLRPSAGR